jgi:parvulin-like peptidyl-prolyl isomerase
MSKITTLLRAEQTNFWRAVILYALGAVIGLGIAGYGLFTAQGTSTRTVPPEDVATVNQRPILRSDFITQLENETGAPFAQASRAQQLKVLEEMVREELLVQRGLELDFAETDQDTRNALVAAMSQLAVAQVTLAGVPDENALRKFFTEHPQQYKTQGTMTVRDLYLPFTDSPHATTLARAQQARAALLTEPVDSVVSRYGLKEDARNEEDWYWVAQLHLGAPLFDHLKTLSANEVSEPLALENGVHVVKVLKNVPPVPLTFEQAKRQLANEYATAAETRLTEETLRFLQGRARILIATDYADFRP